MGPCRELSRLDFLHKFVERSTVGLATHCRSEGFPRTGYLVPAHGTPGVLPDGQSCWDAAAAGAGAAAAPRPPGGSVFQYFQIHGSPECLVLQYFQIHGSKNQVLRPKIDILGLIPSPKRLLNIF